MQTIAAPHEITGSANWPSPPVWASAMLDEQARKYASERISYAANKLIGEAGLRRADFDDIRQAIWLNLIERLKGFDAGRAQLHTFITRVVEHEAADIIEQRSCACRDWRREQNTLDEIINDEDGQPVRRVDTLLEDVHEARIGMRLLNLQHREVAIDIQTVIDELPPELRVVCELLKTQSAVQVAQHLSLKRTALYRRIARIRKHFEEAGLQGFCRK